MLRSSIHDTRALYLFFLFNLTVKGISSHSFRWREHISESELRFIAPELTTTPTPGLPLKTDLKRCYCWALQTEGKGIMSHLRYHECFFTPAYSLDHGVRHSCHLNQNPPYHHDSTCIYCIFTESVMKLQNASPWSGSVVPAESKNDMKPPISIFNSLICSKLWFWVCM